MQWVLPGDQYIWSPVDENHNTASQVLKPVTF
jgi:hypothetical protein